MVTAPLLSSRRRPGPTYQPLSGGNVDTGRSLSSGRPKAGPVRRHDDGVRRGYEAAADKSKFLDANSNRFPDLVKALRALHASKPKSVFDTDPDRCASGMPWIVRQM